MGSGNLDGIYAKAYEQAHLMDAVSIPALIIFVALLSIALVNRMEFQSNMMIHGETETVPEPEAAENYLLVAAA